MFQFLLQHFVFSFNHVFKMLENDKNYRYDLKSSITVKIFQRVNYSTSSQQVLTKIHRNTNQHYLIEKTHLEVTNTLFPHRIWYNFENKHFFSYLWLVYAQNSQKWWFWRFLVNTFFESWKFGAYDDPNGIGDQKIYVWAVLPPNMRPPTLIEKKGPIFGLRTHF